MTVTTGVALPTGADTKTQRLRSVDPRSRRRSECGRAPVGRCSRTASTPRCFARTRATTGTCTGDSFANQSGVTITKSGNPVIAERLLLPGRDRHALHIDGAASATSIERHRACSWTRRSTTASPTAAPAASPIRRTASGRSHAARTCRASCSCRSTARPTNRQDVHPVTTTRFAVPSRARHRARCERRACRSDQRRRRRAVSAVVRHQRHLRRRGRAPHGRARPRVQAARGYAKSPLDVAVPGIGPAAGDTGKDPILNYVAHARHDVRHDDHRSRRDRLRRRRVSHGGRRRLRHRAGCYVANGTPTSRVDRPDLAAAAVEHRSVGEPERLAGVSRRRARRSARRARRAQDRAVRRSELRADRDRLGVPAVRRRRHAARRSQHRLRTEARVRVAARSRSSDPRRRERRGADPRAQRARGLRHAGPDADRRRREGVPRRRLRGGRRARRHATS